jgi:hypothetical protein
MEKTKWTEREICVRSKTAEECITAISVNKYSFVDILHAVHGMQFRSFVPLCFLEF